VATEEGTPQGGPLSPLLANILLIDLDKELERRGHRFVRYADDCNIYVQTKRAGEASVRRFLQERLRLRVNEAKRAVDRPWKRKFLGFSFYKNRGVRIRAAAQSLKRAKAKIRELTGRSNGLAMKERIRRLNAYLRGWMGYYALSDSRTPFEELDEWVRCRLRSCLWKQWKLPKTRPPSPRNARLGCQAMGHLPAGDLAHGPGNEQSPGHRLLAGPGPARSDRIVPDDSSILANRRMRPRMSGGVRGRGLAAPSYSIVWVTAGR
jgi:hypothetical protein